MKEPITEFGRRVSLRLKDLGMTRRSLGSAIGISESAVSRYVSAERTPNAMTVSKIADVLHVTTDWLLASEADEPDQELIFFKTRRAIERNAKNWTPDQKATLVLTLFGSMP